MSLRIRLARGGAKKRPFFRIVIADSRMPRDGRFIERVGSYDPLLPKDHEKRIILIEDRIKHWLSVGARPTDRVHRFLDGAGLLKREPRNNPHKAQPGQKRLDREEAKREAEAKAKEEAEAAAAAPTEAPAEEAPPEETPAEAAATEAASEEAPAEAAAEEAPAEEAPAEAVAEEARAEEAPAEETPAEEAPAEEAEEKKE